MRDGGRGGSPGFASYHGQSVAVGHSTAGEWSRGEPQPMQGGVGIAGGQVMEQRQ